MMSKKGNMGLFGMSLLIGFVFFMIGMIFVNPINSTIDSVRTDLTCSAAPSSLSSGNMFMCLLFDIVSPYFIIGVLSVFMGIITARLMI